MEFTSASTIGDIANNIACSLMSFKELIDALSVVFALFTFIFGILIASTDGWQSKNNGTNEGTIFTIKFTWLAFLLALSVGFFYLGSVIDSAKKTVIGEDGTPVVVSACPGYEPPPPPCDFKDQRWPNCKNS